MQCLTLWEPWLWLCLEGLKDVENRPWYRKDPPRFVFLHSAKQSLRDLQTEWHVVRSFMQERGMEITLPSVEELFARRGTIQGRVCMHRPELQWTPRYPKPVSPWAMAGQWQYPISQPVRFKTPLAARGAQMFWEPTVELQQAMARQFIESGLTWEHPE